MNLHKHELIGRTVVVADSTDPSLVGLRGIVRDETRNMLIVETPRGERKIPKHGTSFTFGGRAGTTIPGDDLRFRPEDRIKKAR